MTYEIMDALDMKYTDGFFDVVIDKSTIDAILCGDDSFLNVARMMKEVQRVLKVGGHYMVISYGLPENRILHFEREHISWNLKYFAIEKKENDNAGTHYCYIAQKNPDADAKCKSNWFYVEKYLILEEEREKLLENKYRDKGSDSEKESEAEEENEANLFKKDEDQTYIPEKEMKEFGEKV